jgi:hypothetical protein
MEQVLNADVGMIPHDFTLIDRAERELAGACPATRM